MSLYDMFLGRPFSFWAKLDAALHKYLLTEKDIDRIDGALSAIRNQGLEERVAALESGMGVRRDGEYLVRDRCGEWWVELVTKDGCVRIGSALTENDGKRIATALNKLSGNKRS